MFHVMKKLKDHISKNTINFITVAGDNYYDIDKKKDKDGKKEKTFNYDNFISGVECLPKDIETYILLGNHEFDKLKYKDNDLDNCGLLKIQHDEFTKRNFKFFKNIMHKRIQNTLIIMFESTVYDLFNSKENIDSYCSTLLFDKPYDNLEEIIKYQEDEIIKLIQDEKNKECTNLIFIGHHPIITIKQKKDKTKKDYIKRLGDFFINNAELLYGKNVYYLCADNHLYQRGIITFNDRIQINQIVVGTGGAELDECPEKIDDEYNFEEDRVKYKIYRENGCSSINGFLEVTINNNDVFTEFIPVKKEIIVGGYYNKYLKYKQKYLILKNKQIKN